MASLAELHPAVSATLATQRIGQPVFARIIHYAAESRLAAGIDSIQAILSDWFGAPFVIGHVVGENESEQRTWCLQSPSALAVVSLASNEQFNDAIDLTLLGTRGAIYHRVEFPPPAVEMESRKRTANSTQYGVLLVSGAQTHQE